MLLYSILPIPPVGTFNLSISGQSECVVGDARFCLDEFHVDGFRYDEISVASTFGGDGFCRDLTATVRAHRPDAIQITEYCNWDRAKAVSAGPEGLGFDAALSDGLRIAVRTVLSQAAVRPGNGTGHAKAVHHTVPLRRTAEAAGRRRGARRSSRAMRRASRCFSSHTTSCLMAPHRKARRSGESWDG